MDLPPFIETKDIMLEKLKLRSASWVSPYVMRHADLSVQLEPLTNRMMLQLDSHVWGQRKTATYELVEKPVYPSWRHQLLASLPEHSFRRRFLERWWDMVGEPLMTRVTHTVTANAECVFPECSMDFPPELGQAVVFARIDDWRHSS